MYADKIFSLKMKSKSILKSYIECKNTHCKKLSVVKVKSLIFIYDQQIAVSRLATVQEAPSGREHERLLENLYRI